MSTAVFVYPVKNFAFRILNFRGRHAWSIRLLACSRRQQMLLIWTGFGWRERGGLLFIKSPTRRLRSAPASDAVYPCMRPTPSGFMRWLKSVVRAAIGIRTILDEFFHCKTIDMKQRALLLLEHAPIRRLAPMKGATSCPGSRFIVDLYLRAGAGAPGDLVRSPG